MNERCAVQSCESKRLCAECNGTGLGIHRFHDRQRIDVIAFLAELVATTLETLLQGDADALHHGTCLMTQLNQASQCFAIGQEIIDKQHMIALIEVTLGDDDGEFLLLGEGIDGGGVLIAVKVNGLRLLGTTGALPK